MRVSIKKRRNIFHRNQTTVGEFMRAQLQTRSITVHKLRMEQRTISISFADWGKSSS